MWLDCDTTPRLRSRFTRGRVDHSVRIAKKLIDTVREGQIGIYQTCTCEGFAGFVFKRAGQAPVFESVEEEPHDALQQMPSADGRNHGL